MPFVVFQGETGGTIPFSVDANIPAVSGYLDLVSKTRTLHRFDGALVSGAVNISRSGIGQLAPGEYVCLPQALDSDNRVYFLGPDDLQVIEVPDFFSSAVLISGDSVLVRLTLLEQFAQGYTVSGTAGQSGGDLYGLYPNPTVVRIQGHNVSATDPTTGQTLIWDGSEWVAQALPIADAYYRHVQILPIPVWSVIHNLGKRPSVVAFDSTGDEIIGTINHVDTNHLTITFSAAVSGEADCN